MKILAEMKFAAVLLFVVNGLILSQADLELYWPAKTCTDDTDCNKIDDESVIPPAKAKCVGTAPNKVCTCGTAGWRIYSETTAEDNLQCYRSIDGSCTKDNDDQCTDMNEDGGLGDDAECKEIDPTTHNCQCLSTVKEYDEAWCLGLPTPSANFACKIDEQCTDLIGANDTSTEISCDGDLGKMTCKCKDEKHVIHEDLDGDTLKYSCGLGLGEECEEDADCSTNAVCMNDKCACDDGFTAINSNRDCAAVATLSNEFACRGSEQCEHIPNHKDLTKPVTCDTTNDICKCPDTGYTLQKMAENSYACAQGATCTDNEDCDTIEGATCKANVVVDPDTKKCQCDEDSFIHNTKCIEYASAANNYSCEDATSQCASIPDQFGTVLFAQCKTSGTSKKCECSNTDEYNFIYEHSEDGTLCVKELSAECTTDTDCGIENAFCDTDQRCWCVKDYEPENRNTDCAKIAGSSSIMASVVTILGAVSIIKLLK